MSEYLMTFHKKLEKKWKGSLVKVENIKNIEPNAKEYLNKLAKARLIERVAWGWYWIPDDIRDIWNFLEKDKNFKVISSQTAASIWNYDFIHRDVYSIKVKDKSYSKALEMFAKQKGWNIKTEYTKEEIKYTKIGGLFVEDINENIIDCLKKWAFADAFATIYANKDKIKMKRLLKKSYWNRISKTNVRIKQALEYGCSKMNELSGKKLFPLKEPKLSDNFVKRDIDDAIEKVMELG